MYAHQLEKKIENDEKLTKRVFVNARTHFFLLFYFSFVLVYGTKWQGYHNDGIKILRFLMYIYQIRKKIENDEKLTNRVSSSFISFASHSPLTVFLPFLILFRQNQWYSSPTHLFLLFHILHIIFTHKLEISTFFSLCFLVPSCFSFIYLPFLSSSSIIPHSILFCSLFFSFITLILFLPFLFSTFLLFPFKIPMWEQSSF